MLPRAVNQWSKLTWFLDITHYHPKLRLLAAIRALLQWFTGRGFNDV